MMQLDAAIYKYEFKQNYHRNADFIQLYNQNNKRKWAISNSHDKLSGLMLSPKAFYLVKSFMGHSLRVYIEMNAIKILPLWVHGV